MHALSMNLCIVINSLRLEIFYEFWIKSLKSKSSIRSMPCFSGGVMLVSTFSNKFQKKISPEMLKTLSFQ